jgi:hypothetical protein
MFLSPRYVQRVDAKWSVRQSFEWRVGGKNNAWLCIQFFLGCDVTVCFVWFLDFFLYSLEIMFYGVFIYVFFLNAFRHFRASEVNYLLG